MGMCVYIYTYKILSKTVDFVLPSGLVLMLINLFVCLFLLLKSFMLRLEPDGTTAEGVVAVKGFPSGETWVRWVNAGRAWLLPAPFPQCAQWGRAPASAPVWPRTAIQAEEASQLGDSRSFPKRAQNVKGGRRNIEVTR